MTTYSPTVRRKRLSSALLALRRSVGLTADEVARKLGWDPSKISRIESNEWKLPKIGDITLLCDVYEVTDHAKRDALIALARQARERGWWEEYKDVLGSALPGLEAEATAIWQYQPTLVPGLLQTRSYMRAVFHAGRLDDGSAERRAEARLTRQHVLARENPPQLWAVLDEAVLRRPVGGREVMRDQVHHLLQASDRPNVTIQVLPDTIGAHALMGGPITIMDYPDGDPTIVFLETLGAGDLYLEAPEEVNAYRTRYNHVMASALSVDLSTQYLQGLLESLKGEGP